MTGYTYHTVPPYGGSIFLTNFAGGAWFLGKKGITFSRNPPKIGVLAKFTKAGGAMNFHQRGSELIGQLKDLVLEVLQNHPDGEPEGRGVTQQEIARRSGLHDIGTAELDHTCREMLSLLSKEGKVESLHEPGRSDKDIHWRLTNV